jgi:branched-chain amino acid transport system ATP-binding protein
MSGAILETKGLTKAFGGVRALSDLDFTAQAGQVHAIIGPNGAGKTTLFNLITGLLAPTKGQVWFQGEEITHLPPQAIAHKGIARTVQITSIFPALTVAENVWLGAQSRGFLNPFVRARRQRQVRQRVADILTLLGLEEKADVVAAELSHGDQRLLEVALALSTRPTLLLLDEPTAGLSAKETRDMVEVIKGLAGRHTIMIVEHDMQVVMELAEVITVLHNGEKIAEGPPQVIRDNAEVQRVYLGGRRAQG